MFVYGCFDVCLFVCVCVRLCTLSFGLRFVVYVCVCVRIVAYGRVWLRMVVYVGVVLCIGVWFCTVVYV